MTDVREAGKCTLLAGCIAALNKMEVLLLRLKDGVNIVWQLVAFTIDP
jgi:hypothetical protein